MTRPEVMFADEPTGALDLRTGRSILALLREAVAELGQTVVMVTHDPVAAACADTVVLQVDAPSSTSWTIPSPTASPLA